jgi:tetratricopeptide (TPR) repeat protein
MLSVCKHMAAGLAVGTLLGAAMPARADVVLLVAGDIGKGAANTQRGAYLTADPVTFEGLGRKGTAGDRYAEGLTDPGLATSLNQFAMLYWSTGRLAAAEPLLERAIAILEKALGPEHPDLAMSLNNLAGLYQATGRYAEAEPLYQRAIAIAEKALGPEHPDLAGRLNNLAVLYWSTDRPAAAEPLLERAIAILEKSLPPGHPTLAAVRENYANLLVQLGHSGEASAARECGSRPYLTRSRNVPSAYPVGSA